MPQYIYILSNASMPGLIKIGKTTVSPSQRIGQLHTTGVPTPFQLECALEVQDCSVAERRIHALLSDHRVSKGREFFRISVKGALENMLPTLSWYSVYYSRTTHGIQGLEDAAKEKRAERQQAQAIIDAERKSVRASQAAQIAPLVEDGRKWRERLAGLGDQPDAAGNYGIAWYLMWCFFPVPVGIGVWLGALKFLPVPYKDYQIIFIVLLIAGFFFLCFDKAAEF